MIIDNTKKKFKKINSLLCVGLDADFEKIPENSNLKNFRNLNLISGLSKTHQYASACKLNSAFYEREEGDERIKNDDGISESLLSGYFTICDAKRADIGNTNNGYVASIFDWLGFDAVTFIRIWERKR